LAIDDLAMLVGRELAFGWHGVTILGEKLLYVVLHSEAARASVVVPFEIDACILCAVPIDGNVMVFAEDSGQVVSVVFSHVFDPKIVNDEAEHDGPPFVAPEAGSGGSFVVTFLFKARAELVVGEVS